MQPVMVTVADLAAQMHMKTETLYQFAKREVDPLPLRTLRGFKRSSSMLVSDWSEWYRKNSELFKDVEHD